MKKSNKIIVLLCFFFVVSVVCGIITYSKNQKNVENLNVCYELVYETIEKGFDKDSSNDNKALFKEVLENGIKKTTFKQSKFYNSELSFSVNNQWSCPEERVDLNIAHTRDLVLAMYLSCVLSTEPENLTNELEWLKDGVWQIDQTPEFIHLIATVYNPNEVEIDTLINAILEFSCTIEHPLDEYHTRAFVYTFVNEYNVNNKADKYVLKNEEEFIKENIEISKEIDKDDFATIWVGYGKVIRLQ